MNETLKAYLSKGMELVRKAEDSVAKITAIHEDPKVDDEGIDIDSVLEHTAAANVSLMALGKHLEMLGGEGAAASKANESSSPAEPTGNKATGVNAAGPGTGPDHKPGAPKPSAKGVGKLAPGHATNDAMPGSQVGDPEAQS